MVEPYNPAEQAVTETKQDLESNAYLVPITPAELQRLVENRQVIVPTQSYPVPEAATENPYPTMAPVPENSFMPVVPTPVAEQEISEIEVPKGLHV